MRTILYAILNTTTNTKVVTGVSRIKTEQILAEMQQANPTNEYKVIYKWASI